jgi:ASPIC and UnbV
VKEVEIRWPSGVTRRLKEVAVDRLLTVTEDPK